MDVNLFAVHYGNFWTGGLMLIGFLTLVMSNDAAAQSASVTPLQGQSAEQIEADKQACYGTAVQSSGFDPAQATAGTQPSGARVRGAARGAAAGATAAEVRGRQYDAYDRIDDDLQQEYRRNEAKSTAAAGAVVGGAAQRRERRKQAAQSSKGQQAFSSAYTSCLMARGYAVQ